MSFATCAEEWRTVPGFCAYAVSDQGRCRRVEGGRGAKAGTILRPRPDHKGYLRYAISDGTRRFEFSAHRLVALAFLGLPPTEHHQVNHLDGDKANNLLSNLEWVTPSENSIHAFKTGLKVGLRGGRNGRAKLSEGQVRAIRADSVSPGRVLAGRFGVSRQLVETIRRGEVWAHLEPQDWDEIEHTLKCHDLAGER